MAVTARKRDGNVQNIPAAVTAISGQDVERLNLTSVEEVAGARYTHETKDSYVRQPYVWPTVYGLFVQYDPAIPATSVNAKQTFDNASPQVASTWRPSKDVTLYAANKTGYTSGGLSNSAILSTGAISGNLQFKPETAVCGAQPRTVAIQLGYKS